MERNTIIFTAVGVILTILLMSFCAGKNRDHNRHRTISIDYLTRKLDLTEVQRNKIAKHLKELEIEKTKMENLKGKLSSKIELEFLNETLDTTTLTTYTDKRISEINESSHKIIILLSEIHSILTPSQRQKLAKMLSERKRN